MTLRILRRKLKTFALTVKRCSNWPSVSAARLGLNEHLEELGLRDGFRLKIMKPLKETWGEIFEPAIADLYGIKNHTADLIVDVGANVGAFACHAAFIHPGSMIYAFEPSRAHAAVLRKNIEHNRLANVRLHEAPVTKDARQVTFSKLGAGGSSGIFLHTGRESFETLQSVSLSVVDFSAARATFIKLDCEGAEGEIIEWICQNVSVLPPSVTIAAEYHPWCPVTITESAARLGSHGFKVQEKILFDESYLFATLMR